MKFTKMIQAMRGRGRPNRGEDGPWGLIDKNIKGDGKKVPFSFKFKPHGWPKEATFEGFVFTNRRGGPGFWYKYNITKVEAPEGVDLQNFFYAIADDSLMDFGELIAKSAGLKQP